MADKLGTDEAVNLDEEKSSLDRPKKLTEIYDRIAA